MKIMAHDRLITLGSGRHTRFTEAWEQEESRNFSRFAVTVASGRCQSVKWGGPEGCIGVA